MVRTTQFEPRAAHNYLYEQKNPKTKEPNIWYVRIKPFNKRAGHLLQNLKVTKFTPHIALRAAKGWIKLTKPLEEVLEFLLNYKNSPGDEFAPIALDVCTYEEAKRVEAQEKLGQVRQRIIKAGVDDATAVKSSDLPSTRDSRDDDRSVAQEARMKAAENVRKAAELRRKEDEQDRRDDDVRKLEAEEAQLTAELEGSNVSLDGTPLADPTPNAAEGDAPLF